MGNVHSGDKAGMSIYMDSNGHYDIALVKKGGKTVIETVYRLGAITHKEEIPFSGNKVWLKVSGDQMKYQLWYSADGKNFKLAGTGDTRYLSSETYNNFTGITIGLWAQSPTGKGYADFEYFEYND
jgi:alpha-N-arabinofuranosidase